METDWMICIKMHTGNGEKILAACDEDIVGQTFRGNGARITVSESFYKEDTVEEEAFVRRMETATIMNLVGERTVALAIEKGYVNESSVIVIGGVKHVQVVKI